MSQIKGIQQNTRPLLVPATTTLPAGPPANGTAVTAVILPPPDKCRGSLSLAEWRQAHCLRGRQGEQGLGDRARGGEQRARGVMKETAVGRDARRHLHQPQHLALFGLLVDDEQSAAASADVQVPAALTVATQKDLLFISILRRQGRETWARVGQGYPSARAADSACTTDSACTKHTQAGPRRGCGCGRALKLSTCQRNLPSCRECAHQ